MFFLIFKFEDVQPTAESSTTDENCTLYRQRNESLPVDLTLIRVGLLRLHCLMESSPPASIPDPEFLNALLFLVELNNFIVFRF